MADNKPTLDVEQQQAAAREKLATNQRLAETKALEFEKLQAKVGEVIPAKERGEKTAGSNTQLDAAQTQAINTILNTTLTYMVETRKAINVLGGPKARGNDVPQAIEQFGNLADLAKEVLSFKTKVMKSQIDPTQEKDSIENKALRGEIKKLNNFATALDGQVKSLESLRNMKSVSDSAMGQISSMLMGAGRKAYVAAVNDNQSPEAAEQAGVAAMVETAKSDVAERLVTGTFGFQNKSLADIAHTKWADRAANDDTPDKQTSAAAR